MFRYAGGTLVPGSNVTLNSGTTDVIVAMTEHVIAIIVRYPLDH